METTEENRLEIRDCMGEIPQANRVKCPTSPIIRNARFFWTRHHHRFPGVPIINPNVALGYTLWLVTENCWGAAGQLE